MYYELYNMLSDFIYGADAVLTEHMELTLTILSTIGALFVVAVPFVVVYAGIRLITGGR